MQRDVDRQKELLDFLQRAKKPLKISEIASALKWAKSDTKRFADKLLQEDKIENISDEPRVIKAKDK